MNTDSLHLRSATQPDLDPINHIIEAAIMTWPLADRVKRLSLPTYKYSEFDLEYLDLMIAENNRGIILGVAAWQPANPKDTPEHKSALLLHGIYVDPKYHRKGIGSLLFLAAEKAACDQNMDGILVKAKSGSELFYQARGMQKLAVENENREFVNRYWKSINNS